MAVISTLHPTADPNLRIFPARPNWQEKFRVSYQFLTDIITSGDGKEQRRAVRLNPRKSIEFSALFHGKTKLSFDAFMATWQPRMAILPEYPLHVALSQPMLANGLSCSYTGDVSPAWLKVGTPVVLVNGGTMETRTVSAASASTILFAETSPVLWPVGTKVCRALTGRLDTEPESSLITNNVLTLPVRFEVDPGTEKYPATPAGESVGFREVFMRKFNWERAVRLRHVYPRNTIDYGYGKIAATVPYDFPSRITTADFIGRNRADVQKTVDFFVRHRGRAREFLLPSWENDVPYFAITGGGYAIICHGKEFGELYEDSTVHRRIVVRFANGTYSHHLVELIEPLPDTNSSILWTVDQLPMSDLSPATLTGISWELVTRFATDRLDIDWITDDRAQYSLTFQSLENFEL